MVYKNSFHILFGGGISFTQFSMMLNLEREGEESESDADDTAKVEINDDDVIIIFSILSSVY